MNEEHIKSTDELDTKGEEPKSRIVFGTPEMQSRLSEITPPSSAIEIMSCNSADAKGADRWIPFFGKTIGNYNTQKDLNTAMQILEIANIESLINLKLII